MKLILASQSKYRRMALEQLGLTFECDAPHIDETPERDEPIAALVKRLAIEKVRVVARRHPDALVLGGDQCATIDGLILGKPGDYDNAFKQLKRCSGRTVEFHSGMCLKKSDDEKVLFSDNITRVVFREISDAEIGDYIKADKPYDCAGSIRCEKLGTALLERIENNDPTSLMGLPLITLCGMLRDCGVNVISRRRD